MNKKKLIVVKYILLFSILYTTISCVTSNFSSYKSDDNLAQINGYYKIQEPNGKINYIKIGIHTIYNRENNHSLYIAFKNKTMDSSTIRSIYFGKVDKSQNDKVYFKKISGEKMGDTVYVNLSDKIYTFYYQ